MEIQEGINKIYKILNCLTFGGIRTLYINYKVFPLRIAIKLPILIGSNVSLRNVRSGCIVCPHKFGVVRLGIDKGSFAMHNGVKSQIDFNKHGIMKCMGHVDICSSFHINISGCVSLGDKFWSNSGLLISCGKSIIVGNEALLGWNVTIIDGDGHHIMIDGEIANHDMGIQIGTHCWLGAETSILKGVTIYDNTVIPYGSIVSKPSNTSNCIYGINNRVVKENINWEK